MEYSYYFLYNKIDYFREGIYLPRHSSMLIHHLLVHAMQNALWHGFTPDIYLGMYLSHSSQKGQQLMAICVVK